MARQPDAGLCVTCRPASMARRRKVGTQLARPPNANAARSSRDRATILNWTPQAVTPSALTTSY